MSDVFRVNLFLPGLVSQVLRLLLYEQRPAHVEDAGFSIASPQRGSTAVLEAPSVLETASSLQEYTKVSGLTEDEADDLAHWLDSTGRTSSQFFYVPDEGFTVYYR